MFCRPDRCDHHVRLDRALARLSCGPGSPEVSGLAWWPATTAWSAGASEEATGHAHQLDIATVALSHDTQVGRRPDRSTATTPTRPHLVERGRRAASTLLLAPGAYPADAKNAAGATVHPQRRAPAALTDPGRLRPLGYTGDVRQLAGVRRETFIDPADATEPAVAG